MPSERLDDDIVRDPEKWLLREQAQAMLDLFAEDCGRTPVMLEEVREWARDQDEKHLRSRVNRRLNVVLDATKTRRARILANRGCPLDGGMVAAPING